MHLEIRRRNGVSACVVEDEGTVDASEVSWFFADPLTFIRERLITSGSLLSQAADVALAGGGNLISTQNSTINQNEIQGPFAFTVNEVQRLRFALLFAGSELQVNIFAPDGTLYHTISQTHSFQFEILQPLEGEWTYTISGIEVPFNEYPFAVAIVSGNLLTDTGEIEEGETDIIIDAGVNLTVNEGDNITFNGNFVDQNPVSEYNILWDFGDGFNASNVLNPNHSFNDNGTYFVALIISEIKGGGGADVIIVNVNNVPPTANFVNIFDTEPVFQGNGTTLAFINSTDVSPEDVDAGFTYAVTCDSNIAVTQTGAETSYTCVYSSAGIFTATGMIRDKDGGISTYTVDIEVLSPIDAITYIEGLVNDLLNQGVLNNGQANALLNKLRNASRQLARNNTQSAIDNLDGFITQVNEFVSDGVLTDAQGNSLNAPVQRLITSIISL